MDFLNNLFFMPKANKGALYAREHKKFQKALDKNPKDLGLKAQYVKFCLTNHFTLGGIPEKHLYEALNYYEGLTRAEHFDPQLYYLVGRYYQGKDNLKAQTVYLAGVRHFNQYVGKNPDLKSDHVEQTYAIALNFVTLQYGQIHPDLERFFKAIRKSYPLHNKRIELENELRKPTPNQDRIQELSRQLRELKEITEPSPSKPLQK